jgi:hypothetical protein
MGQAEIELIRKSAKARKLIKDLREALDTVATISGVGKGSKNGKA